MKKLFASVVVIVMIAACQKNSSPATVADNSSAALSKNSDDAKVNFIKIGSQKWMTANLDVTHYRNGDAIPQVKNAKEWDTLTSGAWCWYNNSSDSGAIYGRLYNWAAVNDPRGLAPEGWHVPSTDEWKQLSNHEGGFLVAGGALKEAGTAHWFPPNGDATNSSGFTALPGGQRVNGEFRNMGIAGRWWTTTSKANGNYVDAWYMDYYHGSTSGSLQLPQGGCAVRCVKN